MLTIIFFSPVRTSKNGIETEYRIFSSKRPGVYFKLGLVNPAFVSINNLFWPAICLRKGLFVFLGSRVLTLKS